jgi:hypothetical protein
LLIDACPTTSLLDRLLNDMLVQVSSASSQEITLSDVFSQANSAVSLCGPMNYIFTGVVPPFVTLDQSTELTILNVNPTNPADVGVFIIEFTALLPNYPMVSAITKQITVTVECKVLLLNFLSMPSSVEVTIGVDSLPLLIPFAASKYPLCP